MEKAIPQDYMTVGQLAAKMGSTVRTLQYYDRVGLLSPSSESEGGRRLYNHKDMIRLYQILSLKSLGFSLDDIKNRLIPLNTPSEVADALSKQAGALRQKLQSLAQALSALEALRAEVLQMQTVDFKKYADIIGNLQMKNEFYWMIKHFDDQTMDAIRDRFDRDGSLAMMDRFKQLIGQANQLYREGVPPGSEQAQVFAKAFWDMVLEFTGGDTQLLSILIKTAGQLGPSKEWESSLAVVHAFIEPALDAYFTNKGVVPLEEGCQ